MQYQITSDNIDMSQSMEILVKEKVQVLDNKLSEVPEDLRAIRVVINKVPEDNFEVKLHFALNGKEYFAQATDFSLEHAIIEAVSELERMLEKDASNSQDWGKAREEKWDMATEQLEE